MYVSVDGQIPKYYSQFILVANPIFDNSPAHITDSQHCHLNRSTLPTTDILCEGGRISHSVIPHTESCQGDLIPEVYSNMLFLFVNHIDVPYSVACCAPSDTLSSPNMGAVNFFLDVGAVKTSNFSFRLKPF